MGIYPDPPKRSNEDVKVKEDGSRTWIETYRPGNGSVEVRHCTATPPTVTWETCYCCTCGEYTHDPYCRNHGFAGTRPCSEHKQLGRRNDDGIMPASVRAIRAMRRRA